MNLKTLRSGLSVMDWPLSLATVLLMADLVIVLASLLVSLWMQGFENEGFYSSVFRFFYVDMEGNLPSWYSSTKLFMLSVMFGLFAWRNFSKKNTVSWMICFMSGIFLVFSLDEAAEIHERIGGLTDFLMPGGDRSNTPFSVTGLWIFLIGIPVAGFLFYLAARLRPLFNKRSGSGFKYMVGLALFLSGALGVELLINFASESSIAYILTVHTEELLEMVGVTVILWATVELIQSYRLRIMLDPIKLSTPTH